MLPWVVSSLACCGNAESDDDSPWVCLAGQPPVDPPFSALTILSTFNGTSTASHMVGMAGKPVPGPGLCVTCCAVGS